MPSIQSEQQLAHEFFLALVEAVRPLQAAAEDREVALHALIQAAGMLQEGLEQELAELRQEAD
jgi:hypothetical protein